MVKCWASIIGGCSTKLSREHYVSQGLWAGQKLIVVSGFEWLKGEEKTIPLKELTANILCTNHNTLLSPLDSEAVRFVKTLVELERVLTARWKSRQKSFLNIRRADVNGTLFERWAVKTIIGCSCVDHKHKRWHQTQKTIRDPPGEIVRAVYGLSGFREPMGLYFAHDQEDRNFFRNGISVETLFHPEGGLVGALLRFRGFRFLVWLTKESPESLDIRDSEGTPFDLQPFQPKGTFRPHSYHFRFGKALSHVLKFEW